MIYQLRCKNVIRIILFLIIWSICITAYAQFSEINKTDAAGRKQGLWSEPRGKQLFFGKYVDNMKQGVWISYYENGIPNQTEEYRNSKLDGVSMEFDSTGKLWNMKFFREDIPHGRFVTFNKSGKVHNEFNFYNGQLNGKKILCYENGLPREIENFKMNKKHGESSYYNEDGTLIAVYHFVDGLFEGEQKTFFDSGKPASLFVYSNNKPDGRFIEYHENGVIKSEGEYKSGEPHGLWITRDEDGRITEKKKY